MIKEYYRLVKPGIIYGNILTTIAGFLFATRNGFNLGLFLATVVGTSLVIGSACVFNNIIDRDIDSQMVRTEHRALADNRISVVNAIIYATLLGVIGFLLLYSFVNLLVVLIGLIGFIDYVVFYSWSKRHTPYATLIGSVCGAMPIIAGYLAVTDHFDIAAALLFVIMVVWQMPHFYAIAIYRQKDYQEAKIPVWPIAKGVDSTKLQILVFLVLYLLVTPLLSIFGGAGKIFFVVIVLASLVWLWLGINGFRSNDATTWARRLFFVSLVELLLLSATLAVNPLLK